MADNDENDRDPSGPQPTKATSHDAAGLADDVAEDPDAIWPAITEADAPRQRAVRIAQIGLVVLVLLIVGIVVLSKDDGSDDAKKTGGKSEQSDQQADGDAEPAKKGWPAEVRGRPEGLGTTKVPATEVTPTAPPGAYIWSDYDGWHLWVVPGPGVPAITGTLTSNDDLGKAILAIEGAGTVTLNGKSANFTLPADKPLAGIDFNPGFYANKLVFTLNGPDGVPLDAALIKTGKTATNVEFPIVIEMVVPDS